MRIAFALLAHQHPRNLADLASALSAEGDPVVIHYDLNSPAAEFEELCDLLRGTPNVLFAARVRCGWGEFSLVQATLNCLERLQSASISPDYVYLVSGSDLPVRPLSELKLFLSDSHGSEFIESFPISQRNWVLGGNQEERFLYRFPFNKRGRPRTFRAFLLMQRWLRIRKEVPDGLELCLGSQFWCLTWSSCQAILRLIEERPDVLGFFRTSWIPDESFFQTLIRNVAPVEKIRAETLTHYRFDARGRPTEYTDADRAALEQTGRFFARKISPAANALRLYCLQRFASGAR